MSRLRPAAFAPRKMLCCTRPRLPPGQVSDTLIKVSFFGVSVIFSENQLPASDQVRGQAFSGSRFLPAHDLIRKPVPTFRDHAISRRHDGHRFHPVSYTHLT